MPSAGLLLTGGASRRMGSDKATLEVRGESLASSTGRLLAEVTDPTMEVGPGWSGLPCVQDEIPGAGPLAAIATGVSRIIAEGWSGPVVVVATDLPRLNRRLLDWLARHPAKCSVVPVAGGLPQPLCARYSEHDCRLAVELTEQGDRSMRRLLDSIDPLTVGPALWVPVAGDEAVLGDADTTEDLERLLMGTGSPGELERLQR